MNIDSGFIIFVVLLLSLVMLLKYFIHDRFNIETKTATEQLPNKVNKSPDKKLTLQEKLELSWKFLQEITNKVLNFSSLDKERIKICGDILKRYGMRYQHIVDVNIKKYIPGKDLSHEKEVLNKRV